MAPAAGAGANLHPHLPGEPQLSVRHSHWHDPRVCTGHSALFGASNAHRVSGGRDCGQFWSLTDTSSRVSVVPGGGFPHESDHCASVTHDGAIPLAPTSPITRIVVPDYVIEALRASA